MRAKDFITERKKKKSKRKISSKKYFFPGFSFYGSSGSESSDSGGEGGESIYEAPEIELAKKLPSLEKHNYDTIDKLMRGIAKKHSITGKILHDLFIKKFKKTPDNWIKNKLDETHNIGHLQDEVDKFVSWAAPKLNLKTIPKIELSMDTQEAQDGHHTGRHISGSNDVWVYAKNRNLVDILRTVFHEMVHCRQGELNMIKSGDSYPGSPIEAMADMLAGKYIKIYGEKNHHIFQ
jgi:hypothetical protein